MQRVTSGACDVVSVSRAAETSMPADVHYNASVCHVTLYYVDVVRSGRPRDEAVNTLRDDPSHGPREQRDSGHAVDQHHRLLNTH